MRRFNVSLYSEIKEPLLLNWALTQSALFVGLYIMFRAYLWI
jgi:hypothetical protein